VNTRRRGRAGAIGAPARSRKTLRTLSLRDDPSYLFFLRVRLDETTTLVVHAFEGPFQPPNHTRIDVTARVVRRDGDKTMRQTLWERGEAWCGIPAHQTIDGDDAKECVLSLLAMKPGDTDSSYFDGWTEDQLAFAETYGETVWMAKHDRFGDR
jgi:hypothetical protein